MSGETDYLRELSDHVVELFAAARRARKRIASDMGDPAGADKGVPTLDQVVAHLIALERRDLEEETAAAMRAQLRAVARQLQVDEGVLYEDGADDEGLEDDEDADEAESDEGADDGPELDDNGDPLADPVPAKRKPFSLVTPPKDDLEI